MATQSSLASLPSRPHPTSPATLDVFSFGYSGGYAAVFYCGFNLYFSDD